MEACLRQGWRDSTYQQQALSAELEAADTGPYRGEILHLRRTYHLGQRRIHWYLLRYHGIKVSSGAVYYVLKRNVRIPEQSDRSFRSERDQRFRAMVTVDSTVNVTAFRHQRNQ